jgi:hypothetical protein
MGEDMIQGRLPHESVTSGSRRSTRRSRLPQNTRNGTNPLPATGPVAERFPAYASEKLSFF